MDNELEQLAEHHNLSFGAVQTLAIALQSGHGEAAQFNHPELGGNGQWSPGGKVMITDANNTALKAKIEAICAYLVGLMSNSPTEPKRPPELQNLEEALDAPTKPAGFSWARLNLSGWWPEYLGMPDASGGQNDMDYAYFAARDRLVVRNRNKLKIYDTRGYQIIGVSHQQGRFGRSRLVFNCQQRGAIPLDQLKTVEK